MTSGWEKPWVIMVQLVVSLCCAEVGVVVTVSQSRLFSQASRRRRKCSFWQHEGVSSSAKPGFGLLWIVDSRRLRGHLSKELRLLPHEAGTLVYTKAVTTFSLLRRWWIMTIFIEVPSCFSLHQVWYLAGIACFLVSGETLQGDYLTRLVVGKFLKWERWILLKVLWLLMK